MAAYVSVSARHRRREMAANIPARQRARALTFGSMCRDIVAGLIGASPWHHANVAARALSATIWLYLASSCHSAASWRVNGRRRAAVAPMCANKLSHVCPVIGSAVVMARLEITVGIMARLFNARENYEKREGQ